MNVGERVSWPPVRLPWLAVAMASGIEGSGATAWSARWSPWAIAAVIVLAIAVRARRRVAVAASWIAIAMLIGAALAAHEREPAAPPRGVIVDGHAATVDDREVDRIDGWVSGPITSSPAGDGFVIDTGDARVWVNAAPGAALPGDRVIASGRLRSPRGFRNPGAIDRRQAARDRGADWEMSARAIDVVARGDRASLWRWPAAIARAASARVAARGGDRAGNALVRAAVLGDRAALDDDTEAAWRAAGVYHALSVSGLHLAVVAMLAFAIGARAWAAAGLGGTLAPRRAAAAMALPLAIAYTLVTGGQVATVRALIVVAAVLGGELLGRRARASDGLGLAALVVLGHRPSALGDPSFQLSFVAAATLIVAAARGDDARELIAPPWSVRIARGAWRLLATSAACALATAPITAAHFQQVAFGGVIGNLIATPLVELAAIPLGLAGAALSWLWPAGGGALLDAAIAVAGVTAWLVAQLAAVTPSLAVPPPTTLELGLGAAVWCAWALARTGRARGGHALAAASAASALLCASWIWQAHARVGGDLRITFVDVGQGDAAVIELPSGGVWLVDAGGEPGSPGDDLRAAIRPGDAVVRFLRARRIDHIDVAILSHPHPDHYLGLLAIGAAMPIGELWLAADDDAGERGSARDGDPARGESRDMARIAAWLAARGTRVVHPALGALVVGDVTVRVLAPRYDPGDGVRPLATADPVRSVNDDSLVVAFERGGRRVLFTGDVEEEGEVALVAGGAIAADVVKVPHHGSPTSSTAALVAATHPRYAVISLGRGNRFGFPGPAVVARWRDAGACVLRTDRAGAVTVRVAAGGRLAVSTFDDGDPQDCSIALDR